MSSKSFAASTRKEYFFFQVRIFGAGALEMSPDGMNGLH
jgi:hypothetical protein